MINIAAPATQRQTIPTKEVQKPADQARAVDRKKDEKVVEKLEAANPKPTRVQNTPPQTTKAPILISSAQGNKDLIQSHTIISTPPVSQAKAGTPAVVISSTPQASKNTNSEDVLEIKHGLKLFRCESIYCYYHYRR